MLIPTPSQIVEDLSEHHVAVTVDAIAAAFAQAMFL